jgi:hypothetical protein
VREFALDGILLDPRSLTKPVAPTGQVVLAARNDDGVVSGSV